MYEEEEVIRIKKLFEKSEHRILLRYWALKDFVTQQEDKIYKYIDNDPALVFKFDLVKYNSGLMDIYEELYFLRFPTTMKKPSPKYLAKIKEETQELKAQLNPRFKTDSIDSFESAVKFIFAENFIFNISDIYVYAQFIAHQIDMLINKIVNSKKPYEYTSNLKLKYFVNIYFNIDPVIVNDIKTVQRYAKIQLGKFDFSAGKKPILRYEKDADKIDNYIKTLNLLDLNDEAAMTEYFQKIYDKYKQPDGKYVDSDEKMFDDLDYAHDIMFENVDYKSRDQLKYHLALSYTKILEAKKLVDKEANEENEVNYRKLFVENSNAINYLIRLISPTESLLESQMIKSDKLAKSIVNELTKKTNGVIALGQDKGIFFHFKKILHRHRFSKLALDEVLIRFYENLLDTQISLVLNNNLPDTKEVLELLQSVIKSMMKGNVFVNFIAKRKMIQYIAILESNKIFDTKNKEDWPSDYSLEDAQQSIAKLDPYLKYNEEFIDEYLLYSSKKIDENEVGYKLLKSL